MVKKFLSVFAVSSMIFATSCSNEDFVSPATEGESLVNFAVQLPDGLNSRAYGDGTTATNLNYSVYEVTETGAWNHIEDLEGTATFSGLTTNVNLRLVNGIDYKVVFWASAPSSPYTYDAENKTVTADYTYCTSNDESLDAFYAVEGISVSAPASHDIVLKRPFAQLNIGTADLAAYATAGHSVSVAGIRVTNVYTAFSFEDENVTGIDQTIEFSNGTLPNGQTFPVAGYDYLTMNYLLVSKDKQTVDVTLNYGSAVNPTYANVPVQRNYRTNIYGNLLTSQEDFTITINPDFDEPDYGVSIWDGTTSELPEFDALGVCHITSASQLAQLMKNTANGNSMYYGKTFVLDADISFANQTISGIGSPSSNISFTFDGNGHTIRDFNIASTNEVYAGLFQQLFGGTVKNLTVKNATVKGNKMVGIIASNLDNNSVIENCTVENCTVYAAIKKAGAITGYTSNSTVKNCVAKDVEVYCADSSEAESGAIVGYINAGSTVENNTASNVKVYRSATAVNTAAEFAALNNNAKNIHILKDIDLTGVAFSTIYFHNNADVNVYGHGHSITGFEKPLFNFYGCGDLEITDLTAKNVTISANAGKLGCGVIAEETQWCNLTMSYCHVENSTINSEVDTRYGMLVGYVIGSADIKECTVKNCNVDVTAGAVGGIIGHEARQAGYNNYAKVDKCFVGNTTLKTADGGDWRVGAIIGTVAGENTVLTWCSTADVTLEQEGKTAPNGNYYRTLYGRIAGGSLKINGIVQ